MNSNDPLKNDLVLLRAFLIALIATLLWGVVLAGSLWKMEKYAGVAIIAVIEVFGFAYSIWAWRKYGELRKEEKRP